MKLIIGLLYALTVTGIHSREVLQPAADGRAYFATNFYRSLVYHMQGATSKRSFVISPGVIQKLLTVIYSAAESQLADRMLWDMRLKHIDSKRLLAEADLGDVMYLGFVDVVDMWQKQLNVLESPIATENVLSYFFDDFKEINKNLRIQNYIVAPKYLNLLEEFKHIAMEYFYTSVLNDHQSPELDEIQQEFGVLLNNSEDLNIFSAIHFNAQLLHREFHLSNDKICGHGNFRYGELNDLADREFTAKVLELNLRAETFPLTMLIVLPDNPEHLDTFLTQILGRAVNDFNVISKSLTMTKVDVKLPRFRFEDNTNLASYFEKVCTRGLHDLFTQSNQFEGVFVKPPKIGLKVDSFWQKSIVQVDLVDVSKDNRDEKRTSTKTFDASDKSYFFVIKKEKVIYFMGHHFFEYKFSKLVDIGKEIILPVPNSAPYLYSQAPHLSIGYMGMTILIATILIFEYL